MTTPETKHIELLKELRNMVIAENLGQVYEEALNKAISLLEREEKIDPYFLNDGGFSIPSAHLAEREKEYYGTGEVHTDMKCRCGKTHAPDFSDLKEEPEKKECYCHLPPGCHKYGCSFYEGWKFEEELPPIELLEAHKISNELHGAAHHKINALIERSNTHSKLINQLRKK